MDDQYLNPNNPPQIETAIIDGDGSLGNPLRTTDRYPKRVAFGGSKDDYDYEDGWADYYKHFYYKPYGDFNASRYSNELNSPGTLDASVSWFGSANRFINTQLDTWEQFSYIFLVQFKSLWWWA